MNEVIRSEQADHVLDMLRLMHTMPLEPSKSPASHNKVWKEFASALSTILTLVPHVIHNTSTTPPPPLAYSSRSSSSSGGRRNKEHQHEKLLAALANASSALALATNALVSAGKQQDTPSPPSSTAKLRRRIASTVKGRASLSRTVGRKTTATHPSPFSHHHSLSALAFASDVDIERVQKISYDVLLHLQQLIMQADCAVDCSATDVNDTHAALITRVEQLVDALFALSSSPSPPTPMQPPRIKTLYNSASSPNIRKTNDRSTAPAAFRGSRSRHRHSMSHETYNTHYENTCTTKHRSQKQRSTGTVGARFMRSISSSFRSSHTSAPPVSSVFAHQHHHHRRSPSPPPPAVPTRSSTSSLSFSDPASSTASVPRLIYSTTSFDESDSVSTWSTARSTARTSTKRSAKSSAIRAIRMLFGSAIIRPAAPAAPATHETRPLDASKPRHPRPSPPRQRSSSSCSKSNNNNKRWSQLSCDSASESECLLEEELPMPRPSQHHLINSRRLSISGDPRQYQMAPPVFSPASLGLNTSNFWEEDNDDDDDDDDEEEEEEEEEEKTDEDDVYLSSTYGPTSPEPADPPPTTTLGGSHTESSHAKDGLSTASSSYFSALSFSSYSSLPSVRHPQPSASSSSSNMMDQQQQQQPLDAEPEKGDRDDPSVLPRGCHSTDLTGRRTPEDQVAAPPPLDDAESQPQPPSPSTLLSKAMLAANASSSSSTNHQLEHVVPSGPSYRSVNTIGMGHLSSVLSKQWVAQSMRTIKSGSNRAPIPAMLPSSSKTSSISDMAHRSSDDLSLASNSSNLVYIKECGQLSLVLEAGTRSRCAIVAGTSSKLIEKLADDAVQDFDYIDTYLLSHASFISSVDLLDRLVERFHQHVPLAQRCIQIKLLNVIERWVKLQFDDFKNDRTLQQRLNEFLANNNGGQQQQQNPGLESELSAIRDALALQSARDAAAQLHTVSTMAPSPPTLYQRRSLDCSSMSIPHPSSLMPARNMSSTTLAATGSTATGGIVALSSTLSVLLCLESKEVAQYLTLADFHLFKSINAYEYMRGHWRTVKRGEPLTASDSYTRILTIRANMLHHWILHEVCSPKMAKQRRVILRKLIRVAKQCIEWNNFHTGMNIILALQSSTVQRLHETWAMLPSRDVATFQALQKYVDVSNNMGFYRQALAEAQAPAVPFFPLVLKDLVFLMDGNPTTLEHDDPPLVNFAKFRTVTRMVAALTQLTGQDYWFVTDLDHCPFMPHASITRPPPSHPSTRISPLDRVAELIEIKLRAVESCYDDPRCSILCHPAAPTTAATTTNSD